MAKKSAKSVTKSVEGEARAEYTRLDMLPAWPRNPKKHNIEQIKASIRRFGFVLPPVVDERTGRLVAGHGRIESLEAMRAANEPAPGRVRVEPDGMWSILVLRGVAFESEKEAEAYLLGDNRLSEIGGWDDEMLKEMLASLQATGDEADLLGVGWNDKEINALIRATDSDRAQGPTPEEKLDSYIGAAIKQLVIFLDSETYDKTIARLGRVMEHAKAESHTDAFLKLLDQYEEAHAGNLPELDGVYVEEDPTVEGQEG